MSAESYCWAPWRVLAHPLCGCCLPVEGGFPLPLIQMRQRKHDTSSLARACLNMIKRTAFFFVQYGPPELDHRNRRLFFTPRFYQQAPPPGYDYTAQYSLP